ncbi:tetratricopeptide repeat protein, putative [Perkinsus marinus ATCC 50983]|uniref:Tetratricopeptide repeat protein, putative n=1 Tax=Perkinsus marinus (strain ATCC 50983 / TXsc) TaxID=423536 RepID=C5LXR1_PERM5|nr:tetratricopeptide repeat protein, putative [Perkinsus marinus ATCC 50983]EEQ98485.1 tetratricopeptide repeat protein, putative [Perkinsus marinus ATCC 50983]|eukprot:XP_002765768.1 tetratricopeptide repeat protein, putative [Perkinsus marinus ATCC 50983]
MPFVKEDSRVAEVVDDSPPREEADDASADGSEGGADERVRSLPEAQRLKQEGNEHYKAKRISLAMDRYTLAYATCPKEEKIVRSQCLANRAACHYFFSEWEEVVDDCTKALELDPSYGKVVGRRANAYEGMRKYTQCKEDLDRLQELDPTWITVPANKARYSKIEKAAEEQFEREKEEMMGKLKDLGNTVLGKFGLSTDNFKCVKDPSTGSYSISFQQ